MGKFYKLIENGGNKVEKIRNKVDKNERNKVDKNERNTQWRGWDIYLALIYWQELSHATAKLMSLFRGWRKKLSSPIDCFSTQFVQPSIPRQNQHPKTSTENMHQNTQANVRNTVDNVHWTYYEKYSRYNKRNTVDKIWEIQLI